MRAARGRAACAPVRRGTRRRSLRRRRRSRSGWSRAFSSRKRRMPGGYGAGVDSVAFLAHLRKDFDAFEACLSGDLTAPVEHCGDWTLRDLAEHLGRSSLWAAVAIE